MRVASIGECMMEFRGRAAGHYELAFGGDTFNTAVYLRRLGVAVDYVTALGTDPFSDGIVALVEAEGVGTGVVARVAGGLPGLYLIQTDRAGERRFYYWRDRAPARELFELASGAETAEALAGFDLLYLSGVTLSLYTARGRERPHRALDRAWARGGRVAFDGNYRPAGWPSADAARAAFAEVLERTDIVLPSFDDEQAVYGEADVESAARRHAEAGIGEVVVKDGGRGCLVAGAGAPRLVAAEVVAEPVDTTAARDSFNAGYLAARLLGRDRQTAARVGHRLAAAMIAHPGAIIPRAAMPDVAGLLTAAKPEERP